MVSSLAIPHSRLTFLYDAISYECKYSNSMVVWSWNLVPSKKLFFTICNVVLQSRSRHCQRNPIFVLRSYSAISPLHSGHRICFASSPCCRHQAIALALSIVAKVSSLQFALERLGYTFAPAIINSMLLGQGGMVFKYVRWTLWRVLFSIAGWSRIQSQLGGNAAVKTLVTEKHIDELSSVSFQWQL